MAKPSNLKWGQIYDSIYGYIRLTQTEEAIINSPYFQRLRWIKQLGFASYIFDGAEHTRFAHAVGVLHCADMMVRAIGKHVNDDKLFDPSAKDEATLFHRSIRIAAMLHDVGTFPFSHSIEGSYIRLGDKLARGGKLPGKPLPSNHEHLGSYIVKKTDFPGGITRILKQGGLDFASLSRFIKGESDNMVANQILHSDLDCDRLDYLIRDAHHTGIQYGHIDRDYILYHLTTTRPSKSSNREYLAIKENAVHAVEDFLIARFAWYSQVVRNSSSAKFDILAAHIASYLLEKGLMYQFHELLELAGKDPERFFSFNDTYFMSKVQEFYLSGSIKDPVLREQMRMLLYRIPPRTIHLEESAHRILSVDETSAKIDPKEKAISRLSSKLQEIQGIFRKYGRGDEWIIADIPHKDVIFTKHLSAIKENERDSVRVVDRTGKTRFLVELENSLIGKLAGNAKFIPNVYGNEAALKLLQRKKIVKA